MRNSQDSIIYGPMFGPHISQVCREMVKQLLKYVCMLTAKCSFLRDVLHKMLKHFNYTGMKKMSRHFKTYSTL